MTGTHHGAGTVTGSARPGRSWLLRLVVTFSFAQGAVSMARPAVSYRALALQVGVSPART